MPLDVPIRLEVVVGNGFVYTMSSGSSGKRVIVPEPSRSMFCLMSRILSSHE